VDHKIANGIGGFPHHSCRPLTTACAKREDSAQFSAPPMLPTRKLKAES
jgi:hypothetical protein